MITRLDSSSQSLLDAINATQRDLNRAQNQVSSGLRITRASDDPSTIPDLIATRSDLARMTQTASNLTNVQSEVQTADGSIQSAVQMIEQAGVLATQGANGTTTPAQRTILSNQVDSILQQIVTISRTQVNGQYIFSGDQTQTPPYAVDGSSPTGVQQLVTAPATRLIQDPTGLTFAVSKTAQELFDARDSGNNVIPGNVFAALHDLKTALAANDQAAIQAAATSVNTSLDYLNQQSTFYGAVENRVSTAIDLAKKFQTQDTTLLSSEQDADVAQAALELTQDTTHLNAALASASKQRTTSLFDYIRG